MFFKFLKDLYYPFQPINTHRQALQAHRARAIQNIEEFLIVVRVFNVFFAYVEKCEGNFAREVVWSIGATVFDHGFCDDEFRNVAPFILNPTHHTLFEFSDSQLMEAEGERGTSKVNLRHFAI